MEKEIYYSWVFSDKKNGSSLWYIVALSIVIGLCIWGFLTQQYGMSLIILFIAGLMYFVENNSENDIEVNITELGIKINTINSNNETGNIYYYYNNINGYSYVYEKENAIYLRLNLAKKGLKILDLKIDNSVVIGLNSILPNFLEEKPKQELSVSEKIILLLKL